MESVRYSLGFLLLGFLINHVKLVFVQYFLAINLKDKYLWNLWSSMEL